MMTRGLTEVSASDHEILPLRDSWYRTGAGNAPGTPADMLNPYHYPIEAICSSCHQVIRCEKFLAGADGGDWRHTGRMAGQDAAPQEG